MPRTKSRLFVSLVAALAATLPGCGGGGRARGRVVTDVSPNVFFADVPTLLTIEGNGFGDGPATVRFEAQTGTPFEGGTAATTTVPGTRVDGHTVTATSPTGVMCPPDGIALRVVVVISGPGGTEIESEVGAATIVGPSLASASPSPIPLVPTPTTLTGNGFGPPGATATVRFTATSGTPFQGGTSATAEVPGTIESATTISLVSPAATSPTTANVVVTLPSGSCTRSPGLLVTFGTGGAGAPALAFSPSTEDLTVRRYDVLTLSVQATDPEGDLVTVRLLNPPAGLVFPGATSVPSGTPLALRWVVQCDAGPLPLTFEARDSAGNASRRTVLVHVNPLADDTTVAGDVTGDGVPDLVVVASLTDVAGVADAGAVQVFAGATTPVGAPTATLVVAGALPQDRLGSGGVRLLDVSGDGVLDVVAATPGADVGGLADAGALHVWRGGASLTGTKNPDATLTATGVGASSDLASALLLWTAGDVSGDGVLDLVAAASAADVAGPADAGAVLMWKGGATLSGAKQPDAVLVASSPGSGDRLGQGGILLAELSGDGTLDVLAGAASFDAGGTLDAGALFLWRGGVTLAGVKAPDATLTVAGAGSLAQLGAALVTNVRTADVTGDAQADVVAAVPTATVSGVSAAGAVYVWVGGAGLSGAKSADATLAASAATADDRVGAGAFCSLLVGDASGDGLADVVAGSASVDTAAGVDAGAWFLWRGTASMTGVKAPDATLRVSTAAAGDQLGGGGARLVDLTNDLVLDVVVVAPAAGAFDTGAVYVWRGGAALSGVKDPDASLAIAGAANADRLGADAQARWFAPRFADVVGDASFDLVVPAPLADVGGLADVGLVAVWAGGASLTGAPAATATLVVTGAVAGDRLGDASAANVIVADLTGDGRADVLVPAATADRPGAIDAGAVHLWRGGVTMTGTKPADAILALAAPAPDDRLGGGASLGILVDVVDVTGDGVRDVVAAAPLADVAGAANAGLAAVWTGGAALTGVVAPSAVLRLSVPTANDMLGVNQVGIDLLLLVDVTGDGKADVLLGGSNVDVSGVVDAGAVLLWKGGAAFSGTPAPTTTFAVPGASPQDRLGT